MRYHYDPPKYYTVKYGRIYECDHPVYRRCTLYLIGDNGLAVIQQRFNPVYKSTRWTEIDEWLNDELYLNHNFEKYFKQKAAKPVENIYPTVALRQIMWGLRMKPLPREPWETYFDRPLI